MRYHILTLVLLCGLMPVMARAQAPLPSWSDDSLKTSIINYVMSVTTEGATGFVPVGDRIAIFDNDGTLWAEKPLIEGLFTFFRAREMVAKNPALKEKQPYKKDWKIVFVK